MKNKLPTTEQLATLTARLVTCGLVPKQNHHPKMFSAALVFWRSCESFLNQRQEIEARGTAARTNGPKELVSVYESVPPPAKFPASFQWLLNNLFDGERTKLRDYIEYCQSCGKWTSGDTESFIAPLLDGVEVEAFQYLTRHWHEWRQARTIVTPREADKKRPAPRPKKKALTRKSPNKSGRPLK